MVLTYERDIVLPNPQDPGSGKELLSKTRVGIYRRLERFPWSLSMCVCTLSHIVASIQAHTIRTQRVWEEYKGSTLFSNVDCGVSMCKCSPSPKELFRPKAETISLKPLMENPNLGALSCRLAYGGKQSFLNFKSASAQGSFQRSRDRSFSHSGVSQLWFQFWNPVHPFLAGSISSQSNTAAAPIKATRCSSGAALLGWGCLKVPEKTA